MGAYNWLLHLTYRRRTSLQANMVTTMHFDSEVFDFNSHFFNVQYNLLNYPINSADRYDTRRRQYWRCWPANYTTGGFAGEGTRVQGEVGCVCVWVLLWSLFLKWEHRLASEKMRDG